MNAAIVESEEMERTRKQQVEDVQYGMWLFLATEVLFFGGLFAAYFVYRFSYPEVFARLSNELDLVLGTVNTAILLTSSYTMALAVERMAAGKRKASAKFIALTVLFGSAFLVIKFTEWHHHANELGFNQSFIQEASGVERNEMFFSLYYTMTGLHGLHMVIGIALLVLTGLGQYFSTRWPKDEDLTESLGLYWHFVDIVWIFLFPLFYLVQRV